VGGSESHSNHDYTLTAKTFIKENAGTTFDIHANGGYLHASASADVQYVAFGGNALIQASASGRYSALGGQLYTSASADWIAVSGGSMKSFSGGVILEQATGGDIAFIATAGMIKGTASSQAWLIAPTTALQATSLCQLEGGSLLTAHGATVWVTGGEIHVQGTGTVTVHGATVNVEGGTVNVTGPSGVNITGGLVKLNC